MPKSKDTSATAQNKSPEAAKHDLPPSLQPSMPEDQATDKAALLELGTEAATLLSAPIFNQAYQDTVNTILDTWMVEQNPQAREDLWFQIQALAKVTESLLSHVNAAQGANLTDQEQAEADLNQWLDEQGFH